MNICASDQRENLKHGDIVYVHYKMKCCAVG